MMISSAGKRLECAMLISSFLDEIQDHASNKNGFATPFGVNQAMKLPSNQDNSNAWTLEGTSFSW
jgi:hypothetical protein